MQVLDCLQQLGVLNSEQAAWPQRGAAMLPHCPVRWQREELTIEAARLFLKQTAVNELAEALAAPLVDDALDWCLLLVGEGGTGAR